MNVVKSSVLIVSLIEVSVKTVPILNLMCFTVMFVVVYVTQKMVIMRSVTNVDMLFAQIVLTGIPDCVENV
jgi:hypothetical protein